MRSPFFLQDFFFFCSSICLFFGAAKEWGYFLTVTSVFLMVQKDTRIKTAHELQTTMVLKDPREYLNGILLLSETEFLER